MSRLSCSIVASVVLAVAVIVAGAGQTPSPALVFTQESVADGASRIAVLAPDGSVTVLTPDLIGACDPSVSFDGKRILFAARRTTNEAWNIWEMDADGGNQRQLTHDLGDCREPLYLARAAVNPPTFDQPVRWIAFTSTAAGESDELGLAPAYSLYVMSLETVKGHETVLWRATYNLGGDSSPTVLEDGRILHSSRRRGRSQLMTVTWAGDNLNPFFTSAEGPAIKTMACELPDRTVVFVESDTSPEQGGRLARVALRRPLGSHQVLSKQGRYKTPHAAAGGLLVSYSSGQASFGIYRFDLASGRPGKTIYDDPAWHDIDAMALAPHPEPVARIPMLEFASVLDIEGFSGAGQLHCMSVYDSDQPEIRQLAPGSVKWARFVAGLAAPAHRSGPEGASGWPPPGVTPHIMGDAPVEPDGSFFVNIAGNTPFYIQLLDQKKAPLYTMQSWIWVRSGSQRGCIGCHENKELAPQNRTTQALLKMKPTLISR